MLTLKTNAGKHSRNSQLLLIPSCMFRSCFLTFHIAIFILLKILCLLQATELEMSYDYNYKVYEGRFR